MIRLRHGKTPYELLHNKPPDLSYLHVFGALCYPTNDSENLGKLQPKADIGLVPNPHPSTPFVPPSRTDWDILFQPLFDELFNPPPSVDFLAPEVIAPIDEVVAPEPAVSTSTPSLTTVDQDAPSPSNSQTTPETLPPVIPNDVEENNHDIEVAHMGNDPYFGVPILEVSSDQPSSSDTIHTIVNPDHQISEHNSKWTKDHPLENIIGELTRPVSTRLQLHEQALNQEELNEFERIKVWELVPRPDKVMVITLKWIYKVKLDELGGILKNKAQFISLNLPGQEEGINFEESFAPCRLRGYKDFYRVCCSYEHGRLPNGCEDCLKKALYGLKQAPRAWYDMLSSFLISQDFSKGSMDPTLFIRREGKELLLISQSPRDIFINQSKYALESLKKYGFDSCDLMDTPMVEKSKLDEDKEGKSVDPSHYRGIRSFTPETLETIGQMEVENRRFYTSAGNPVKEILLKLNLLDHSDEVLKLKNFKKDATLKLSKSTNQEWYKHVGPEVTRSQMTKSQDGEMRLCLVDDLTVLKITSPLTSKDKGTS
ncbi:retrovirus-related pol polyprotein from transposon TNT 1-94 [Tanacetum coccineum]